MIHLVLFGMHNGGIWSYSAAIIGISLMVACPVSTSPGSWVLSAASFVACGPQGVQEHHRADKG
jgi:hypothetical protein